ncbi:MAG: hypothetical protein K2Q26_07840 [Bdellovibrionales bacterium]|nr:hypothetical protein [Bdellovibrionales bacterium]
MTKYRFLKVTLIASTIFSGPLVWPNSASPNQDLTTSFRSFMNQPEGLGASRLDDLKLYLKKVCEVKSGQQTPSALIAKACQFPQMADAFQKLTELLMKGNGENWEAPQDWNENTLRSGYWNISPFADVTPENPEQHFRNTLKWLILKKALVQSLGSAEEVLRAHNDTPSATAASRVLPALRAYLQGLGYLEQQAAFLEQMRCKPNQPVCQQVRHQRIEDLASLIKEYGPQMMFLRERLQDKNNELSTDTMDKVRTVQEMDSLLQSLDKNSLEQLIRLLENLNSNQTLAESLREYADLMKIETQQLKNLSDTKKIQLWNSLVEMNDWKKASEKILELQKNSQSSKVTIPSDLTEVKKLFLRDLLETIQPAEQFLKEEGLDLQSIPNYRAQPNSAPHKGS